MPANSKTPSYRLHKPTGQTLVTLNGPDFYLGNYGTLESRQHESSGNQGDLVHSGGADKSGPSHAAHFSALAKRTMA